ncbi:MAG TPA: amidohydrolase family protein [Burkholderiales bacterium]|nr:amidohydrolase family protein [Burkholderiales bacterium]
MGKKLGERTPRVVEEYDGLKGRFFFTGSRAIRLGEREKARAAIRSSELEDAGFIPAARVSYQQQEGIQAEVLNPTDMMHILQERDRDLVRACCEVYNDWLAEFCSYNPERLLGVALTPIEDVNWAQAELQRTWKKGLRGGPMINLEPPEGFPPYHHAYYDPFWSLVQELDMPLMLHSITGRVRDPFHFTTPEDLQRTGRGLFLLMGEIMGVLSDEFIQGGILDRFPRLKLICAEFEISWLPWFLGELDGHTLAIARRQGRTMPKRIPPSEYVKTNIWASFIDDPFAKNIIPLVGADRIVWGTDFPHPRLPMGAQEFAANFLKGLPRHDQEKVVGGNAASLWSL